MPPMRDGVPVKCVSTSSVASPTASKICAPQYDEIVEMPIFEIVFSRPLAIALDRPLLRLLASSTPGSRPSSTSWASVASITYGLTAAAP